MVAQGGLVGVLLVAVCSLAVALLVLFLRRREMTPLQVAVLVALSLAVVATAFLPGLGTSSDGNVTGSWTVDNTLDVRTECAYSTRLVAEHRAAAVVGWIVLVGALVLLKRRRLTIAWALLLVALLSLCLWLAAHPRTRQLSANFTIQEGPLVTGAVGGSQAQEIPYSVVLAGAGMGGAESDDLLPPALWEILTAGLAPPLPFTREEIQAAMREVPAEGTRLELVWHSGTGQVEASTRRSLEELIDRWIECLVVLRKTTRYADAPAWERRQWLENLQEQARTQSRSEMYWRLTAHLAEALPGSAGPPGPDPAEEPSPPGDRPAHREPEDR